MDRLFVRHRSLSQCNNNFRQEEHISYLMKALREFPISDPNAEAHRLVSLFFVVSGLDLLGAIEMRLDNAFKQEIIDWIYSHQVCVDKLKPIDIAHDSEPHKLCSGSNNCKTRSTTTTTEKVTRYGRAGFRATSLMGNEDPLDCGNISMTYSALTCLVILGDDLRRLNKQDIISGLRHLQTEDGCFQQSVYGGDCDMRMVYCAIATSSMLNDWSGVDKDACGEFIKSCWSYEGGFAQRPGAEAHGGSTYCAIASLIMISKLQDILSEQEIDCVIRWCIVRLGEGFSGRPNKDEDTCYSFWVGACLVMLDHFKYIKQDTLLSFILQAQESDGGLSKKPGFIADPLHTYLGLAGLTFIDDELRLMRCVKLQPLEPMLNISMRATGHLRQLQKTWQVARTTPAEQQMQIN